MEEINKNNMYKVIWTEEKKEKAIQALTKYFERYGHGECIGQNDEALLDAPDMLGDIADDILIDGEGLISEYDEDEF